MFKVVKVEDRTSKNGKPFQALILQNEKNETGEHVIFNELGSFKVGDTVDFDTVRAYSYGSFKWVTLLVKK